MKLNKVEFLLMNNPIRAFIQKSYEIKKFRNLSSLNKIENVLEIGCGNGYGAQLINDSFNPKNIYAVDLDEKMIRIANQRKVNSNVVFKIMDATKLDFPDNYFDIIFDFGIIHHIPNWRLCIDELSRVLKPNGEILIEELSIETFTIGIGNVWRSLLKHPYKDMFTVQEFKNYLTSKNFKIEYYKQQNPLNLFRFFTIKAHKKIN